LNCGFTGPHATLVDCLDRAKWLDRVLDELSPRSLAFNTATVNAEEAQICKTIFLEDVAYG